MRKIDLPLLQGREAQLVPCFSECRTVEGVVPAEAVFIQIALKIRLAETVIKTIQPGFRLIEALLERVEHMHMDALEHGDFIRLRMDMPLQKVELPVTGKLFGR